MMKLRVINNRNAVLKKCIFLIGLLIIFSLFSFWGIYWQNKYATVGIVVWLVISDVCLIILIGKRYIEIHVYENYMIIKEYYLLRAEKVIRSERIVYYEIIDFYQNKNILVFSTKNREMRFLAKYLTEAERAYLEGVLSKNP